MPTAGRRRAR